MGNMTVGGPSTTDSSFADAGATPAPEAVAEGSIDDQGFSGELAGAKGSMDGVDVSIFDVSARGGDDGITLQGNMSHVQINSDDRESNASFDTFSARATLGKQNLDGSRGLDIGATANAVAIEGTVGSDGYSLTGGLSVGVGAEASVGVRDIDHDGSPELCARVSVLFFTLGACAESPL